MLNTVNEQPSFIVQNVTLGYHFVSDIGLSFGPREVKDLTWEDEAIIKKSRNLKDSIRSGILKQLSQEEYDKTLDLQYQKEKKQLLRDQKDKNVYKKVKVDDKDIDADTFDLNKGKQKSEELDLTGTANHPMSYVAAYEIAAGMAMDRGDELTAEEFGEMVENNPGLVPKLLAQTKSSASDFEIERKSYYAVPGGDVSNSAGVVQAKMMNLNRDAMQSLSSERLADKTGYIRDALDLDADPDGNDEFAEEIDLLDED
jgi:hypothetical protein